MNKAGIWGLLWMACILEIQGAPKSEEEEFTLTEGQTLEVTCPFNVMKYKNSRKAWQRVSDGGELLTLAMTEGGSEMTKVDQTGKYHLEEIPLDGVLKVRVTDLQVEDSGLYQCVIFQPPKDPFILYYPIRLVVTKDPPSDINSTQRVSQISTLPPTTTKAQGKLRTSPRTVTQLLPMSTASLSSPGIGVNPTPGTNVSSIIKSSLSPRISLITIITIVVCGILSKSLVFTVLLVVTQRSFGP
ncbi:PREDICTED: triggering receptor expressed on myeloid cells 1 [Miniopterus natalensis]|uniref:triggering receptor expressed on myeloid cells 1 n=1 Tax=Miniopterus natalensis TaxID=291302 RepID=UPI0007A6BAA9|nr:PREDICTED: triggering receptor expressed on myeloid cells 1 [Miniopterus natalensis]